MAGSINRRPATFHLTCSVDFSIETLLQPHLVLIGRGLRSLKMDMLLFAHIKGSLLLGLRSSGCDRVSNAAVTRISELVVGSTCWCRLLCHVLVLLVVTVVDRLRIRLPVGCEQVLTTSGVACIQLWQVLSARWQLILYCDHRCNLDWGWGRLTAVRLLLNLHGRIEMVIGLLRGANSGYRPWRHRKFCCSLIVRSSTHHFCRIALDAEVLILALASLHKAHGCWVED